MSLWSTVKRSTAAFNTTYSHYAKKSLELNLKTFLKPSDVKTCLEKALESFQQVYLNFI